MVDENRLLAHIALGDRVAFQDLYTLYYQRLWQYVRYHLDAREEWIEEVLQDIFLAVWRSAPRFRGDAKVATWIFQIAHHTVISARRLRGRQMLDRVVQLGDDADYERMLEDPLATPFEESLAQRMLLIEAIEQLSPKHQEVIFLIFVQGFTQDEVALILGVPMNTIRSRIIHARRGLQRQLARTYLEEVEERHA